METTPVNEPRYRLWTAVIILILYVALCIYMISVLSDNSTNAPNWDHALVVFNAFGAIAMSAAGVLLGTEIQQETVNSANRESARIRSAAKEALGILSEAPAAGDKVANDSNKRAAQLLLSHI
jgi:hypothetical protein